MSKGQDIYTPAKKWGKARVKCKIKKNSNYNSKTI